MTLVECMTLAETFATTIFSVKLMHDCIVVESTRKYRLSSIEIRIKIAKPLQVRVKTEYLLMDFLSMIGAVGGTLGLCIGFSIKKVLGFLPDLFELS